MNFGFSDEQEFLRSTAREFLERQCPMSRVRELLDDPKGFRPELWAQMAELGWLGLLIPEELGGAGLSFVDLVLVLEEQGRALTPSPFHANLQGTLAVLRAASDAQRKEILSQVASGQRILSFAITEEAGTEEPDAIELRAEPKGEGFSLHGTKLFVPDGQNADTLVVLGRSGPRFALFLVQRDAPGVEVAPLQSMDQTRRIAEVRFEGAPAERLGGEGDAWEAWQWVRDRALVALAADAVGGAEKTLADAVAYAKERVQFGKPIGVHQAIKHKCADMLVLTESAKSITYYAAWAVSEQTEDAPLAAAMAKSYASDAYRHCSAENIQIHGGVGFTWEYDCHLYFKRAKAIEVTYGDPTSQRERVAQLLKL
jgi:alkylation response protein AidB-like acyl-CoA dehydrogenase